MVLPQLFVVCDLEALHPAMESLRTIRALHLVALGRAALQSATFTHAAASTSSAAVTRWKRRSVSPAEMLGLTLQRKRCRHNAGITLRLHRVQQLAKAVNNCC